MKNRYFPAAFLENSVESYLPRISVRSQGLYVLVLVGLAGAMLSLPFVVVDVTVQSAGVVRSASERTDLKALVSGTVAEYRVHENQLVRQGQVLLRLNTDVLDSKLRLTNYQQTEKQQFIADLKTLDDLPISCLNEFMATGLQSPMYRQQFSQFKAQMQEIAYERDKVGKEFQADGRLYEEKVIAMREFDEKKSQYDKICSRYKALFEQQRSQWQGEFNAQRLALNQFRAETGQIQRERALYEVRATVTGTVQQLVGKYVGSPVQAGEVLGILSPDSGLLAECYVSPHDIGFLREGMPVHFQVDAFNYREWGQVGGTVSAVARDFVQMNQQPVFKVTCRLNQTRLRLKNGYAGTLKKGMTLRGQFTVARRSLLQLLYDDVDDWLNPKME